MEARLTKHTTRLEPHKAHQTAKTRTGSVDTTNRKPYRTASQREQARATARLVDGRYVSNAPVSFSRQQRRQA